MSVTTNRFAANLRTLRLRSGKTQIQVAGELVMNQKTLAAYEEGRGKPDYDRLIAIADHFKITVDDLLKADLKKCITG